MTPVQTFEQPAHRESKDLVSQVLDVYRLLFKEEELLQSGKHGAVPMFNAAIKLKIQLNVISIQTVRQRY